MRHQDLLSEHPLESAVCRCVFHAPRDLTHRFPGNSCLKPITHTSLNLGLIHRPGEVLKMNTSPRDSQIHRGQVLLKGPQWMFPNRINGLDLKQLPSSNVFRIPRGIWFSKFHHSKASAVCGSFPPKRMGDLPQRQIQGLII